MRVTLLNLYTERVADAQRGWKAKVQQVEVGCGGFVAKSPHHIISHHIKATPGNKGARQEPQRPLQSPEQLNKVGCGSG